MSRSRSPVTKTHCAFPSVPSSERRNGPFCCMTHCKAFAANNVMQQQTGLYVPSLPRKVISAACMWIMFGKTSLGLVDTGVVCCGQTAGWIKMPLCTEVGHIGPGDIVLDGDPAPSLKGAHTPNFRPMSIVAKRLYESKSHLVREYSLGPGHIVLQVGDPAPPPHEKGQSSPLHFSAYVYCGQTAG